MYDDILARRKYIDDAVRLHGVFDITINDRDDFGILWVPDDGGQNEWLSYAPDPCEAISLAVKQGKQNGKMYISRWLDAAVPPEDWNEEGDEE